MYVTAESNITISDNAFTHNRAVRNGGAMYSLDSIVNIYGSTKNSSILSSEGYCRTCDMITTIPKSIPYEEVIMELNEALCATHFTNNTAKNGGAISIDNSTVVFSGSVIMFRTNSAVNGGAMEISRRSRVALNPYHLFICSNKALLSGGGFEIVSSNFRIESGNAYFLDNSAAEGVGIFYSSFIGDLLLSGNSYFIANRARTGNGGAVATSGTFTITASAFFIENTAATYGGAIYTLRYFNVSGEIVLINNSALSCGGAMYIDNSKKSYVHINNVSAIGNSNSALCIHQSNVIFSGRISICNNTGTEGGGIKVTTKNTQLYFTGSTVLYGNKAELGGAIYSQFGTELTFSGDTLFSHNTADTNGGAIYSEYTNITFDRNSVITFKWNTAENGGAIYLNSASSLNFNREVYFTMSYNHATKYGGGIYNEDIANANQCSFELILSLPYCFIIFLNYGWHYTKPISQNNSAGISGSFLHGGLLDRCQSENTYIDDTFILKQYFQVQEINHEITSEPYQLCFCVKKRLSNCTEQKDIEIYPGQKFPVSLIAST